MAAELQQAAARAAQGRAGLRLRLERARSDLARAEREAEAEAAADEAEIADMVGAYRRLESLVMEHLRELSATLAQETNATSTALQ